MIKKKITRVKALVMAVAVGVTSVAGGLYVKSRSVYAEEPEKVSFAQGAGTGSDFSGDSWKFKYDVKTDSGSWNEAKGKVGIERDTKYNVTHKSGGEEDYVIRLINGVVADKSGANQLATENESASQTAYRSGEAFLKNSFKLDSKARFSSKFTISMPEAVVNPAQTNDTRNKNDSTYAREVGGDGIAFVMTTNAEHTTRAGSGIGYQGIGNSIAIELDSYFNGSYCDMTTGTLNAYSNWQFDNQLYFHDNWDYNNLGNYYPNDSSNPYNSSNGVYKYVPYRNYDYAERFDHIAIVKDGDVTKHLNTPYYLNGLDPTELEEHTALDSHKYYSFKNMAFFGLANNLNVSDLEVQNRINSSSSTKKSNASDCATRFADEGVNDRLFTVWLDYDGENMYVSYATGDYATAVKPATAQIKQAVDMSIFEGKNIYLGFTSAVGSSKANHTVHSFSFTNTFASDYKVEYYLQDETNPEKYNHQTADDKLVKDAEIGSKVKDDEHVKNYDGYEFVAVPGKSIEEITVDESGIVETEAETKNVLRLYYKLKKTDYKVEHYLQKEIGSNEYEIQDADTQTVANVKPGINVKDDTYVKTSYDGYEFTVVPGKSIEEIAVDENGIVETETETKNILRLYYNIKTTKYTVEHYKQEEVGSNVYKIQDADTQEVSNVKPGIEVKDTEYVKTTYTGYNYATVDGMSISKITVTPDGKATLKLYYNLIKPDTASYKVEYYLQDAPGSTTYTKQDADDLTVNDQEIGKIVKDGVHKKTYTGYEYVTVAGQSVDEITVSSDIDSSTLKLYYNLTEAEKASYVLKYWKKNKTTGGYDLDSTSETKIGDVGTTVKAADIDDSYSTKYVADNYSLSTVATQETTANLTEAKPDPYVMNVYYDPDVTKYKIEYYKFDKESNSYKKADESDVKTGYVGSTHNAEEFDANYATKFPNYSLVTTADTVKEVKLNEVRDNDPYTMKLYYDPQEAKYKVEYYVFNSEKNDYECKDTSEVKTGLLGEKHTVTDIDTTYNTKYPGYKYNSTAAGTVKEVTLLENGKTYTMKLYYNPEKSGYMLNYFKLNPNTGEYVFVDSTEVFDGEVGKSYTVTDADSSYVTKYEADNFVVNSDKNDTYNVTVAEANKTYEMNVYYDPAKATYKTEYYLQQPDGSYQLTETVPGTEVYSGTEVTAAEKQFTNYTHVVKDSLSNEKDTVKSDNSTTLKVYYDLVTTSYTVKYYLQDRKNTSEYIYQENDTITKTAIAGSTVSDSAHSKTYKDYAYALVDGKSINEIVVNEDGTSELRLYYNLDPPVYAIQYYVEQEDGSFKLVTEYSQAGILSETGEEVSGEHITIDGYVYDIVDNGVDKTNDQDIVKGDSSTILKLYYRLPKYTVQYYVENEDGEFELYTETDGKDRVNQVVTAEIITIDGYTHVTTPDSNETDSVASDDSTVLKVYYKLVEEETTTKKPEKETTTKKPEKETTTKKPEKETTTKKPEKETTTKKPEKETTTKKPEKETTTKKPEKETTIVEETTEEETTTVEETTTEKVTIKQETTTSKPPVMGDRLEKSMFVMLFTSAIVAAGCIFARKKDEQED